MSVESRQDGEQQTTLAGHTRDQLGPSIDRLFEIAIPGEDIPPNALYGVPGEITEEYREWARQQIADMKSRALPVPSQPSPTPPDLEQSVQTLTLFMRQSGTVYLTDKVKEAAGVVMEAVCKK